MMSDTNLDLLTQLFVETRDVRLIRSEFEPHFRRAFDEYTAGQPADEFIEALFERLKIEPFPGALPFVGNRPGNWLWAVMGDAAAKAKRITPDTIDAILEAIENREAILAIERPPWLEYGPDGDPDTDRYYGRRLIEYQIIEWFRERKVDWRTLLELLAA